MMTMIQKLNEEYRSSGLHILFGKTEQLIIGEDEANMTVDSYIKKIVFFVRYLGVILPKEGSSDLRYQLQNKTRQW